MAETHRAGLTLRNGQHANKLVRQTGKTNLLQSEKSNLQKMTLVQNNQRPIKATVTTKATFTIYEDKTSPQCDEGIDENNIIHLLERKCKEEQSKVLSSRNSQKSDRLPFAPLNEVSTHKSDSEEDLYSARSYATDTSVRNELLSLDVGDLKNTSASTNVQEDDDFVSLPDEENVYHEECLYAVPHFDENIYEYMRCRETKGRPKPDFLRKQKDITKEMRHILIDWLSDVVCEYNMSQETLHLAVSLVDRALSRFHVQRERLQLVGATSMMIAAKFEEVMPLETKDFVYLTDDTYTISQLLLMERAVLQEINFDVSMPTAVWFANRLINFTNGNDGFRCAVEYLLDLTLVDPSYLEYKPSYVAASCLCYANILCEQEAWSEQLEKHSGISLEHIKKIFLKLHSSFEEAPESQNHAIYTRYSEITKHEVATISAPKNLPFDL